MGASVPHKIGKLSPKKHKNKKIWKEVLCNFKLSPMRNKSLQLMPTIDKAVEIYATTPEVTHQQVADLLGIERRTLLKIRRDPNFWTKVYDYYMATFEGSVVDVLKAAVREAKAGNVQAQRLVLEHSGKLQKNINITIDSPFEKWLKKSDSDMEVPNAVDAEIINDDLDNMSDFSDLPPRTADNSTFRPKEELKQLRNAQNKAISNKRRNELRRENHKWFKRAKAVGIEPLPSRRPTVGQKKEWQDSIIKAEQHLASDKNQE